MKNSTFSSQNLVNAIEMPAWLERMEQENAGKTFAGDEAKIRFTIELAVANVKHQTGGPFGAAIFDEKTEQLLAVGVNRVVPAKQSWTHAEMTAMARTQNRLDLLSLKGCVLASSCEPCAMCMGAIPWSGIDTLIFGASEEMASAIHFDEGDKPENWRAKYLKRGITVRGPLLPEESQEPFSLYQRMTGVIY